MLTDLDEDDDAKDDLRIPTISQAHVQGSRRAARKERRRRHRSVHACIEVSVEDLRRRGRDGEEIVERFLDMAVFAEDVAVPIEVLERWWGRREAKRTIEALVSESGGARRRRRANERRRCDCTICVATTVGTSDERWARCSGGSYGGVGREGRRAALRVSNARRGGIAAGSRCVDAFASGSPERRRIERRRGEECAST